MFHAICFSHFSLASASCNVTASCVPPPTCRGRASIPAHLSTCLRSQVQPGAQRQHLEQDWTSISSLLVRFNSCKDPMSPSPGEASTSAARPQGSPLFFEEAQLLRHLLPALSAVASCPSPRSGFLHFPLRGRCIAKCSLFHRLASSTLHRELPTILWPSRNLGSHHIGYSPP